MAAVCPLCSRHPRAHPSCPVDIRSCWQGRRDVVRNVVVEEDVVRVRGGWYASTRPRQRDPGVVVDERGYQE